MLSTWTWIAFNLIICTTASLEDRETKAFIELTELGYEDTCHETAEAEWAFINAPSNNTLSVWEEKLILYADFKKSQKDEVANISNTGLTDSSLKYKYNVIEKAGDSLLPHEDFQSLAHFSGAAELIRLSRLNTEEWKNYTRKDVERALSHNNNVENKTNIWVAWHEQFTPLLNNFSSNLLLVQKAAEANGAKDVREYWELLSGYEDGYDKIKYQWNRVSNLHKKILDFGLASLSHKYGISINETIPAYLLGTLQGNDWTAISSDVTPHPELMHNIKKNLWKRKLLGNSLYKTASAMGNELFNQVPQADFWDYSQFNKECPSTMINFCREGIMRVSTCFEPTISSYLSAHKNVGKILFNQMSVESTPILNFANRQSALEEGVSEVFGILSASPAWLNNSRLIDNSTDSEQQLIVSLMITALDVLPRLAYYLSADMWRINAIESGITEPSELVSTWWRFREEYEGVVSNGSNVPTFLMDNYIIQNKPYLPKYIGAILGFQLYENLMDSTEVRYDSLLERPLKPSFIKMIQHGAADNWLGILDKYLEIDDILADSLTSFFSPLEDFIDDVDEEFQYKSIPTGNEDLEVLRKKILAEINAPTTTTARTTTATVMRRIINTAPPSKQNIAKSNVHDTAKQGLESKSSVLTDEKKQENDSINVKPPTAVPFDVNTYLDDMEEEKQKPKINNSKATYAVGAVIIATIVICVIAIFGRQRCRKTPKNRRYV